MKSLTHLSTLHLSFKIKRCVDRLSRHPTTDIKRTGQHDWHGSFPNRWIDSLVDTIFYIFVSLAWPVVHSVVKFLGPGLLCFWHRVDQQRERLAEAGSGVRFPSIVPETHHDEIVRGNHQRGLPAGARHVIGIARDWILPVAVEPEESSIDRPIVRGPGGRKCADECGVALWENALTFPDAALKKEIAKPRPIAPGAHLITLP